MKPFAFEFEIFVNSFNICIVFDDAMVNYKITINFDI